MGCGKANMHDFILAKEIAEEIAKIASEKKLVDVKSVNLEIGSITLAHDGLPEHTEDTDLGNLRFSLESIAPKYGLDKAKFNIKKNAGDNWKITNIEV
jgi:Zn finger protein HypA/HybF involved in hydrogenase expression